MVGDHHFHPFLNGLCKVPGGILILIPPMCWEDRLRTSQRRVSNQLAAYGDCVRPPKDPGRFFPFQMAELDGLYMGVSD